MSNEIKTLVYLALGLVIIAILLGETPKIGAIILFIVVLGMGLTAQKKGYI